MNDEPTRGEAEDDPADQTQESLNEALSALEGMLQAGRSGPGAERADRREPAPPAPGGQYTIPLLDDVVLPGAPESPDGEVHDGPGSAHRFIEADEFSQALIRRLASELEIIVQTGVEEAMKQAQKNVLHQVKKHMDIVLPEILEEILVRHTRDR